MVLEKILLLKGIVFVTQVKTTGKSNSNPNIDIFGSAKQMKS